MGLPDLDRLLEPPRSLERDLELRSPFFPRSLESSLSADLDLERLLERDRSLGGGDLLRLLDLDRPPLSLPPRDLDLLLDLDRGLRLRLLEPPERDLRLALASSISLIRLPLSSAPSNLSRAVFISLSEANSTHPSFLLGLCASA